MRTAFIGLEHNQVPEQMVVNLRQIKHWPTKTTLLFSLLLFFLYFCVSKINADPGDHIGHWGDSISIVAVDGNWGVINEGTKIRVMDLSNPANPVMRGTVELGMIASQIALIGNHAYCTCAHGWFYIINISNPDIPTIEGTLEMGTWPECLWVRPQEDYAYVGECSAIAVIDISNRSNPTVVRRVNDNLNTCVYNIIGDSNGYLYVVSGFTSGFFSVWEMSTPEFPTFFGGIETVQHSFHIGSALAVMGDVVYWGTNQGLYVVNTSSKSEPAIDRKLNSMPYQRVFVKDQKLYTCAWRRYAIYDLSVPLSPLLEAELTEVPEGICIQVEATSKYVYAARTGYLEIVDISDSASPISVYTYSITPLGRVRTVARKDDVMFLGHESLVSLSLANPAAPSFLDSNSAMAIPTDMIILNDYLFSCSNQGIESWDISNPSDLMRNEHYTEYGGFAGGMDIEGSYLACCNREDKVTIFNIGVNGSLAFVSDCTITSESIYAVALKSPALYALSNNGKLYVYDISNPSSPTYCQTIYVDTSNQVYWGLHDCKVYGGNLHVFLSQRSYTLFSLLDPLFPVRETISPVSSSGDATGISFDGNNVYLSRGGWLGAGRNNAVEVLDISNPSDPVLKASLSTPDYSRRVETYQGYLYVPCQLGALQIYEAWPSEQAGSLQVTVTPQEAIDAGAQWRRVGTLTWLNSGHTESGISLGAQMVEFKSVNGWNTPDDKSVTINNAQISFVDSVYVNSTKYANIRDFLLGLNSDPSGLDYNGDGLVDIADLVFLIKHGN